MTKIQKKLLEKLKYLKKILDKNNIKFFLDGGTLIGAIRNKGFLKWDDDIDICIYEEDIEKFINVISKDENMNLKNYKNVTLNSFFKVYFLDTFVMNNKYKSNLKIDVFVLYKERKFSFWLKLMRVMTIGYLDFKSYEPIRYITKFFPFTKKWLQKRARNIILKGKIINEKIGYLYDDINFWDPNKNTNFYYGSTENVTFENLKMRIPKKARQTMKRRYGDILIPPKNNDKKNHDTKLKN